MGLPEARLPDGSAEPTHHPWLSILGVGVSDKTFPARLFDCTASRHNGQSTFYTGGSKSASPQPSTGAESPMLMLVAVRGNSLAIYLSRQQWVLIVSIDRLLRPARVGLAVPPPDDCIVLCLSVPSVSLEAASFETASLAAPRQNKSVRRWHTNLLGCSGL
jgi:hypothetical protein